MDMLVRLSLTTGRPLEEVLTWEPEHVATALVWLKELAKAQGK